MSQPNEVLCGQMILSCRQKYELRPSFFIVDIFIIYHPKSQQTETQFFFAMKMWKERCVSLKNIASGVAHRKKYAYITMFDSPNQCATFHLLIGISQSNHFCTKMCRKSVYCNDILFSNLILPSKSLIYWHWVTII